jgi:nucleotide-binding universal stress UspA family protein
MAVAINADLLLVHVVTIPLSIAESPVPTDIFDVMSKEAKVEIELLKTKLQEHTNDKVTITTQVIVDDLVDDLIELASGRDTFAIVMGVKGAEESGAFWFGSNTVDVMQKIDQPVITVPGNISYKHIAKVGIACDLENTDWKLPLTHIEILHNLFGCELHVLNVTKDDQEVDATIVYESIDIQNDLRKFNPRFHFLVNERIEAGLGDFVSKNHIDLMVVMPKDHGFFGNLFHKSISKQIMTHSKIPVLSLHTIKVD